MLASEIRPGAILLEDGEGLPTYIVQSVRINRGTRESHWYDRMTGEVRTETEEKGSVSCKVAFTKDGGDAIRRFELDQEVPLVNADLYDPDAHMGLMG